MSNGAALTGKPFGYLIFGIDDKTHEVTGTTFDYRKRKQGNEDLENWLVRLTAPRLGFSFQEVMYSEFKKCVVLEIPASYIQPTSFEGVEYIRIGSYRKELKKNPQIEQKLWNSMNIISFEQLVSKNQNLHFKGLKLIMESKGLELTEKMFPSLRMVDSNGKFNNLALLLSDENPFIVKFAVYASRNMDFRVKKEFSGSWAVVLDQVLEYSNIYNDVSAKVIGNNVSRTEIQSYPNPSLRESIVNAFGHMDFSFPSDIKIEFYPDGVEIGSPGCLYRTTMNDVLDGRQSFRNPNLIFVLNKLGFIENYATGIRKIKNAYTSAGFEPQFVNTDNFFIVKLPNINFISALNDGNYEGDYALDNIVNESYFDGNDGNHDGNADGNDGNHDGNMLSEIEISVLQILMKNPSTTVALICRLLQKSRPSIERAEKSLKEKGFIKREGSTRGKWVILKRKI